MKTILVIENESDILENLAEAFEMEGHKVLTSNNGTVGVALAKEFIPDLIVSAIQLGKMDGYMVLQALLDDRKTQGIPVIFSTTKSENRDRSLAIELGVDDYIVKPYALEEIMAMANRWISSGSQRAVKNDPTHSLVQSHPIHPDKSLYLVHRQAYRDEDYQVDALGYVRLRTGA